MTNTQTKIVNFILGTMLFFLILTFIVAIVSYIMSGLWTHGFIPVRILFAIYFAHRYNIQFFKKSVD